MPFLPFVALAGLVLLLRGPTSLRGALVRGSVVWGAILVVITELLSPFNAVTFGGITGAWLGVTIATFGVYAWQSSRRRRSFAVPRIPWPTEPLERAQLAFIGAVLAVTLALAIMSAPSTWDALVYHLSRIEHWIQNGNVAPYPTQIPRQLWPAPGAEFLILHERILAGTDRVVTLVQWLAFAGNIVVASRLAAQLGAGRKGQIFAAFLTATLPSAVAQASGAQVELVFSFWLACAVSLALELRGRGVMKTTVGDALLFGAAIGLAVFAKALAYIYLLPFLVWLAIATFRQNPLRAARTFAIAGVIAIAIIAPQYHRNFVVFGDIMGQKGADGVVNTTFSAPGFASNVMRNALLHFGTRSTRVNAMLYDAVVAAHRPFGISANDPATSFAPFVPVRLETAEATASCPLHVLLFIGVTIGLVIGGFRRHRPQLLYALSIIAAFLLFCFYLRWQPWHSRLHAPLLILAGAIGWYGFERVRWRFAGPVLSVVFAVGALPALLVNPTRPLLLHQPVFDVPRELQYFASNPDWYPSYRGAADFLKKAGCDKVGLKIGGNDFEYALWALLADRFGARPSIRHVQVTTESATGPATRQENFIPCAIVYIHSAPRQRPFVVPPDYRQTWQQDSIRIFLHQP
jgi:hypothetical protein